MALTVYGIPTCGTVKKARRWLEERGTSHDWVDLRATPPDRERVAAWVGSLGSKALRNTSGRAYRQLPDDKKTWSDARWIDAFASDPMLIKRPVVERNGVAVIAGFRASDEALSALLIA